MDNSEEPALCPYGTPLEPLEEDEVPSKKRIAVEDQIVTDENGRRRFHGAFTGGFSAGFWNTVGSLEGWKPKSFKSSRSEKAEKPSRQLPTDFMDDEDLGEFGIAPQRVQAKEDFAKTDQSTSNKRKLMVNSGPIPGIPVLQQLFQPPREKVAVRLLRRMGWKPGQGIGARQTKSEKTKSNKRNNRELYVMRMYGCATKPEDSASECPSDSSEGEPEDDVTFAPDDFEPFVCSVKDNVFGLGYSGLGQLGSQASSHVNLFSPLEVMGKDNKKLSIRGQAFGVGALEEEDEDIYARDDMSRYDFTLGNTKKNAKKKQPNAQDQSVLEGFAASSGTNNQRALHRIDLKANFQPRNWLQRKTRFDTLSDEKAAALKQNDAHKLKGLGRHDLTPDERGAILKGNSKPDEKESQQGEGEKDKSYLQQINEKYKAREERAKKMLELVSSKADNFVKGGLITESGIEVDESVKSENKKILSEAKEITKALGSTSGSFKPFAGNEAKQERYEKFIQANLRQEDEIKAFLATIQPLHLSEWDREMERKEFIQAQNIYKPLNGIMSERFVSKAFVNDLVEEPKPDSNEKVNVVVERTKSMWKPSATLCKRFNIPEPYGGALVEPKVQKKNKFSVFDYIEHSVNSKKDFVTPVIIPKHIEKPKVVKPQADFKKDEQRESEKKNVEETLTSEKPTIDVPQPRETFVKDSKKAKTELEIRIEETKNKHPSEKKDLFKCIFDSSSDEEDAQNEDVSDLKKDNGVPLEVVRSLTKPSAPINLLRNNSPPRGIFAALLTDSKPKEEPKVVANNEPQMPDKITFTPSNERHAKEKSELSDVYGPKVPTQLINPSSKTLNESEIDKKLIELLALRPSTSSRIVEKWVEKKEKSTKKSKKEKKEKKKHHKDRSKHKKAKKKKDN